MTPHQATPHQTLVAPLRHRLLTAATVATLLASAGCFKQPGGDSSGERTGLFGNATWITSGSAAQFTVPGVSWTCIVDVKEGSVSGGRGAYSGQDGMPSYATVSGSVTCGDWSPSHFEQQAVPGEFRAAGSAGGPPVLVRFLHADDNIPPQVEVTVATTCLGQCPGANTDGASTKFGGGSFSGLSGGLGAKWIVSPPAGPGAAQFQVALPGQGPRECLVYVTAVEDHRQSNSGDDYGPDAPVSGEVYCAPYAPVGFNVSVPSNTFAEVRPRALNPDGPPVLLTFWSTSSLPPQANVGVTADCPTGTCPPPPAVGTTPGPVTTPVPVVGGSRSRDSLSSGTDTVFDAEKHWYLCQDGIDSAGQRFYCPRQGYDCVREPREYTAGTFIQCRETTNACEWADGNTFRECLLNDGRIGWAYCNIDGHWNGCQAPGNKRGECSWVFGQLASIWGPDLGELPGRARTALLGQKSGCTAGDPAATPTPQGSSSSPTSSYAASGTAGNTAPPASQSLCGEACSAGSSCVFAVDFNPIGRSANKDSAVIVQPTCMSLNDFKGRTAKLPEVQATAAIGYRQCRPDGATGWCGVGAVFTNGGKSPPLNPTACTRVPSTPLGFGFRLVGLRVPPCSGVQQ